MIFKAKAVRKRRLKTLEPESYFPSKDHPDYQKQEFLFLIKNCLPDVPTQESTTDWTWTLFSSITAFASTRT